MTEEDDDALRLRLYRLLAEESGPKRLDPLECGCLDCCTGYSKPLEAASLTEILDMTQGRIADATSHNSRELLEYLEERHRKEQGR